MGVFNLIFAVFLLVARGVGRSIPERVDAKDIALLGVATHKLSLMGPQDGVTSPLRAPFTELQEKQSPKKVDEKPRGSSAAMRAVPTTRGGVRRCLLLRRTRLLLNFSRMPGMALPPALGMGTPLLALGVGMLPPASAAVRRSPCFCLGRGREGNVRFRGGHVGRLVRWLPALRAKLLLQQQLLPAIATVPLYHGHPSLTPESRAFFVLPGGAPRCRAAGCSGRLSRPPRA